MMRPISMTSLGLLAVLAACTPETSSARTPESFTHEELRARSALHLETIDFIKPRSDSESMDPYQAPILYREALEGAMAIGSPRILEGELSLGFEEPTVYHYEDRVGGQLQRSFFWFQGDPGSMGLQGVRVTHDRSAQPALVEVLKSAGGARLFYASRSLEESLEGPPLEGRAFALEQPLEARPEAVLIGTFSQGSEPLGPIVYSDALSGELLNVHCRCTASAITNIRETLEYRLVDWRLVSDELRTLVAQAFGAWVDEEGVAVPGFSEPRSAWKDLRLPDSF